MTAPGDFSSGDVLTAADMNALPGGVKYLDQTAAADVTVGTTLAVIRTTSFTFETGRRYKVSVNGFVHVTSTTLTAIIRIMIGGFRRTLHQIDLTSGQSRGFSLFAIYDGTGASETVQFDAVSNAGTFDMSRLSSRPAVLVIEDIGPS